VTVIDYGELARALLDQGLASAIATQIVPAPQESLLTRAELASRWNVTPPTIDRLVREGMPVEYVTLDAPRFDRAACDAWRKTRPAPVRKAPATKVRAADANVEPVSLAGVRRLRRRG
jgi:hypothetical protein